MPTVDLKHCAVLFAYAVLTAVINLVFSKRSQIDEWCEANPKLAFLAKFCRGFGVDPWTIVQSLVLLFTSKLPGYQKQSLAELKKPKAPFLPLITWCLCFGAILIFCGGCTWFAHSVEPVAKACAPSPASLVTQVSEVLLSGDAYEAKLEQLAVTDGEAVLQCAVQAAIKALVGSAGTAALSPDRAGAVARGNQYLSEHPAQ